MGKKTGASAPAQIEPFDAESGDLNVIIETPQGSRNKYKWDVAQGLFMLGGVMPAGAVFPYDFGYVPATRGEDGDPLDVLVLMDAPAFCGCLVRARLVGAIEAVQTERDGTTERNDRLIAVASESHVRADISRLSQLNENLIAELEHYFIAYNQARGKEFKPLRRAGPRKARSLVEEGIKRFKESSDSSS